MRLAYASDLHADLSPRNAALLPHLAAYLQAQAPDVFIIAGDLAETVEAVESSLNVFRDVPGQRFYLPGNHDLFAEAVPSAAEGLNSRDKFETSLPRAASRAGFRYLGLEAQSVAGITLVGVPGWFDFSLRDPALASVVDTHAYRAGQWRGLRAFDRGHMFWPSDANRCVAGAHPTSRLGRWAGDEEILAIMLQRLENQLQSADDKRRVVAVVHVLPFAQIVVRGSFGVSGFFDAYLGSARLGGLLERDRRCGIVISGHLHRHHDQRIGHIRSVSSPLGDARKHPGSLEELARSVTGWIDPLTEPPRREKS